MDLFINERSFRGQFRAHDQFRESVTRFLQLVEAGRRALRGRQGRIWRSEGFGDACAIEGETLHQSLNRIAGRELFENFRTVVYDMANPAPWEPEREHTSDDLYLWHPDPNIQRSVIESGEGDCITNSSMAELAARTLKDVTLAGCLLNVEGSSLDGRSSIDVFRVGHQWTTLSSSCIVADFEVWLHRSIPVDPPYGPDDTEPPRDEQTCLIDTSRFKPTGAYCQGRKIYRHITSKQHYYVDNFHFGRDAQLEVFDKFGKKHLGEASLDGKLRPKTNDPNKKPLDL